LFFINRASEHLELIVMQLVRMSQLGDEKQAQAWQNVIVGLVRDVVSSVDPNVRCGDAMDIRPYVKLKIIPGYYDTI
jgi:hypothetical protein